MITTSGPALLPIGNGVAFDYVPLILFEQACLDRDSFDFIQSTNIPALNSVRESVIALREEGFLDATMSFREQLAPDVELLKQAEDECVDDYRSWLPLVRKAAKQWRSISGTLQHECGVPISPIERFPYGIAHFANDHGLELSDRQLSDLETLLFKARPNTRNVLAQDVHRHVVRCYLASVHTCMRLAERLGASWYDWENLVPFYERKATQAVSAIPDKEYIKTGRHFFHHFQVFLPTNVGELIKILKDSRVKDLRHKISDLAASGAEVDERWVKAALAAMEDAKSKAYRAVDISGYLTTWIPVPLVGKVLEKGVERLASQHYLKPHKYLFFTGLLH